MCPGFFLCVFSVGVQQGKQHALKFDKHQVKIAGLFLFEMHHFAFCLVHKLCVRCALLFTSMPKGVCVSFFKKKKVNGLLGSVLTCFYKLVTSVFLLPAQFEGQINSMTLPSQNSAQEEIHMFFRFNLLFL